MSMNCYFHLPVRRLGFMKVTPAARIGIAEGHIHATYNPVFTKRPAKANFELAAD
jgi:hypothetical protein